MLDRISDKMRSVGLTIQLKLHAFIIHKCMYSQLPIKLTVNNLITTQTKYCQLAHYEYSRLPCRLQHNLQATKAN